MHEVRVAYLGGGVGGAVQQHGGAIDDVGGLQDGSEACEQRAVAVEQLAVECRLSAVLFPWCGPILPCLPGCGPP